MARILAAIIAGGQSRRFGSDKAALLIDGRPMVERIRDLLFAQLATVVLCGRTWPGMQMIEDYPIGGIGPLGGLCAALRHARQ